MMRRNAGHGMRSPWRQHSLVIVILLISCCIRFSASTSNPSSLSATPPILPNATLATSNNQPSEEPTRIPKQRKKASSKQLKSKPAVSSSKSDTLRRIEREWKDMIAAGTAYNWKEGKPVKLLQRQHVWIGPIHSSLLVWHFTLVGLPDSPYGGGLYHGRLILPDNYPMAPPRVQVWTPSGRFVTRHDICLTASNYHEELWTSNWTIRTIIEALRLHFVTHALEIGGINESYEQKLQHAKASRSWYCRIPINRQNIVAIDHAKMIQQGIFADLDDIEGPTTTTGRRQCLETCLGHDRAMSDPLQDEDVTDVTESAPAVDTTLEASESTSTVAGKTQPRKKKKKKKNLSPELAFISAKQHPTPRLAQQTVRVRPAPEPSLFVATVQKLLKRPVLWCSFFLFCYLNAKL